MTEHLSKGEVEGGRERGRRRERKRERGRERERERERERQRARETHPRIYTPYNIQVEVYTHSKKRVDACCMRKSITDQKCTQSMRQVVYIVWYCWGVVVRHFPKMHV